MEMRGSRLLPVERESAWTALNDPAALQASIPGCESIERTGDGAYEAVVAASIGPVKARFRGRLTLTDVTPPERYTLHFEGQGGAAGFASGSAKVELVPEGSATRLAYAVNAQVGGRIAQVGQRLIDAAAAKIADDFFDAFSARLAPAEARAERERSSSGPLWAAAGLLALMIALVLAMR